MFNMWSVIFLLGINPKMLQHTSITFGRKPKTGKTRFNNLPQEIMKNKKKNNFDWRIFAAIVVDVDVRTHIFLM